MAPEKALSDLQLGIRELFRIVVPGIYGVLLVFLLVPDSAAAKFAGRGIGPGFGASFFVGLLGYALRPHERWAPYFLHFEKYRAELNSEITRIVDTPPAIHEVDMAHDPPYRTHASTDHVALYKLFLEVKAPDAKDRIHYFSSFYYMLVELSLFSWIAAYWLTATYALSFARDFGHRMSASVAMIVIAVGVAAQIALLCGLRGLNTKRSKIWLSGSLLFAAIGIFIPFCATWNTNMHYLALSGWAPNIVPIALVFAAFAFERLGRL